MLAEQFTTNTMSEEPNTSSNDLSLMQRAIQCKCPRCAEASLYETRWTLNVRDHCPVCKLDLSDNDSADGPAYILIFVLGAIIVPCAIILEFNVEPPLWVHAVLWTSVALIATLLSLRPLKALVINLLYKADPGRWRDTDKI